MLLAFTVLLPFLGSLLLALVPNHARSAAAWLAALFTLTAGAALALQAPAVFQGEILRASLPWMPQLGVAFALRLDGLALLFALLILGIGALVVLYARYYLSEDDPPARFFSFLLLFMGAMLGLVTAGDLVLLVVFWELTSISSFLLIGFWRGRSDARQGARMALTITGAGGLCLFAGVLLLGRIVGSYDLDVVLASGDAIRAHALYVPALLLVLAGAFAKSAQFPLHFWLPHAMAAPTPVSAYLHSATMVKAGVFLLARLHPALAGSETWFWVVSATGAATLLIGAYLAVFQHDLKGLLAYSTISHLGLITLLLGLGSPLAVVAAVFHILNHAVFKASLFMAAGIIDHECGTRDMRKLNGLWRYMPYTGALAMIAASAMAGVPLLNGFLSKEMFFAETLSLEGHAIVKLLVPAAATLAGVFSVAYSLRFIHDVFFNGEPVGLTRTPHEPPRWMRIPVELLAALCLAVGVVPGLIVGSLLAVGARGALGTALPEYSLAIWHGFNLPLAMSALALVGGIALYLALQRIFNLHAHLQMPRGGKEWFEAALGWATRMSARLTGALHDRSQQRYLVLILLVTLAAAAAPFFAGGIPDGSRAIAAAGPLHALIWSVGVIAALAAVWFYRRRLIALLMLGVVGMVVSLSFVHFSAPDLALTQLLVEFATIVLMMLALHYLPAEAALEMRPNRLMRDALIAVAAGAGVAALAWAMLTRPLDSISGFFLEKSVPEGGGTNAVNVIIVDFRGLDTLGEITVLGIAGLAIAALLAGRRGDDWPADLTPLGPRDSLMLQLLARALLPLAALLSIYLFLRGHNQPGGGFIAGLVLAVALIMQQVASGHAAVQARLPLDYRKWIGWGLLIAGATGVGSFFVGFPFLTSTFGHPVLPVVGELPIASAMFFDLGVYLTVVGATLVALASIGRLRREEAA